MLVKNAVSGLRYRIDTVFGQYIDRCSRKRVWVRGWWHVVSHLLRRIMSHTVMFLFGEQSTD
ncbi:MAG: hypothetical protein M3Q29_20805 [Chloroflexota bacterium]|nr:hypothetical protein [Chloroflexota bacterium]